MKKLICIFYICIASVLLTGCSRSGTVFTAYRDIAALKIIQTVGIDPGLRLTVTSGESGEDSDPVLLSAEGSSMGQCMETLQDYATDSELFYSHLQYILLSQDSAAEGIGPILDYMERSVDIRMKTAMFLVRGDAGELMTGAGSGSYNISRVLSSLMEDVGSRGRTRVYTCAETARSIAQCGGGLVCALSPAQREGAVYSGDDEGGLTAVPDGFGILCGDRLVDFLPAETTDTVCILTGRPGSGYVTLNVRGFDSTVQLCGSEMKLTPRYENGALTAVDVSLRLSALLTETDEPETARKADFLDELGLALSREIEATAQEIFRMYALHDCDFLALGPGLRAKNPTAFDRSDWYSHPGGTEFCVKARSEIVRTYENGG